MSAPTGILVTAFPVPGYNFRCQDEKVRGVNAVANHNGVIRVLYLDDSEETYEPEYAQEVSTTDAKRYYGSRER